MDDKNGPIDDEVGARRKSRLSHHQVVGFDLMADRHYLLPRKTPESGIDCGASRTRLAAAWHKAKELRAYMARGIYHAKTATE